MIFIEYNQRQGGLLLETLEIARRMVDAISSDKQGTDIILLDTRGICTFADYFIVCTGESTRQVEAIAEEAERVLNASGRKSVRREGSADSGWVLLDASDLLIHIFDAPTREFYQFDSLWSRAAVLTRLQ